MAAPQLRRMTPDEFFDWQSRQDKLFELVDGLPYLPIKMMTGATQTHDRIVVNVLRELANQLRRGPCRPTTDDLAVRIPGGNVRRPDVTVECGQPGPRDVAVAEPRVVIEVLSPSTMSFDRVRKLPEYQTVPSITDILLVDTQAARLDCWSRTSEGWRQTKVDGLEAEIALPSIGATLRLADIYEDVTFEG